MIDLSGRPLHHVGIIYPSEEDAAMAMQLLGLEEDYRGYVPQFEALCIFTRGNGASPIEFVIPSGGPLAKFNKGAGGMHHIALQVPSLANLTAELAEQGITLLEPEPVKGAGNFLCNFLSPAHTRGLIVEFIEVLDRD